MTATQMHRARDINAAIENLFAAITNLKHHGFAHQIQLIDLTIDQVEDVSGVKP